MGIHGFDMGRASGVALVCALGMGMLPTGASQAQQPVAHDAAEQAAILKAAGAQRRGASWVICDEDPNNPEAQVVRVWDLNGDGRPEALVMEEGIFCHGFVGLGYHLLTRQADGRWTLVDAGDGVPEFLETRGGDGWPDMSVGGPGFCFPVLRWNGSGYALHRHEYQGEPCQAP